MSDEPKVPVARAGGATTQRGWSPPTRRTFVSMIAAAAAAFALRPAPNELPRPARKTRWIGHC